jgi:hypothetical protein
MKQGSGWSHCRYQHRLTREDMMELLSISYTYFWIDDLHKATKKCTHIHVSGQQLRQRNIVLLKGNLFSSYLRQTLFERATFASVGRNTSSKNHYAMDDKRRIDLIGQVSAGFNSVNVARHPLWESMDQIPLLTMLSLLKPTS